MALAKAPNAEIPIDTESPIVSDITVSPTSAKPGTQCTSLQRFLNPQSLAKGPEVEIHRKS